MSARQSRGPPGGPTRRTGPASARKAGRFVIPARPPGQVHYELHLEIGGRLMCWEVPLGPEGAPGEVRLAIPAADRPLPAEDTRTVVVWDEGWYENLSVDAAGRRLHAAGAVELGRIVFEARGRRLRGTFALTRVSRENDDRWLLVRLETTPEVPRRPGREERP